MVYSVLTLMYFPFFMVINWISELYLDMSYKDKNCFFC